MIGARRSLVAGRAMDEYLHRRLFDKGVRLRPHYAVRKRPSEDQPSAVELAAGAAPQWTYEEVKHDNLHPTFERHHLLNVVRDCREHVCSVSDVPFDEECVPRIWSLPLSWCIRCALSVVSCAPFLASCCGLSFPSEFIRMYRTCRTSFPTARFCKWTPTGFARRSCCLIRLRSRRCILVRCPSQDCLWTR